MHEAYFDESGDFEEDPKVFCLAGYYISTDRAIEMDKEWNSVLKCHNIPYFHMVDCAHGNYPFDKMDKASRVEILKKLIAIIKEYTIEGLAILGKDEYFDESEKNKDIYSTCVDMSVTAIERFLDINRIKGPIAYFFETGHKNRGRAYQRVADKLHEMSASLTWGKKAEIRLLQAADLLAWQAAKYVKDSITGVRKPRKDFLSLMEHRHMLSYITIRGEDTSIAFEAYPLARRSEKTVQISIDDTGPLMSVREGNDPTIIVPIKGAVGYRLGGGQMAYVGFQDFKEKTFVLAFDEMRLFETIAMLVQSTELYGHSDARFSAKGFSVKQTGDSYMISVLLDPRGSLSFDVTKDAASWLINALREAVGGE